MGIYRSIPSKRIINGHEIVTSDSVVVTNKTYITNGEYAIVVKDIDECVITLDSKTTDHVLIKSMTNVLVTSKELIDEEFNEVELNRGACVEFKKIGDYWYILGSDGLKNS